MKTSYKRLLQIISTLFLLFFPWMSTWSCGPDNYSDDFRFVLFRPELAGVPELADLRYNIHMSVLKDSDPQQKDYQRNCSEWQRQLGGTVSDIFNIQYGMEPDEFLYAYRHNKWADIKDNSFLHALLLPANKAFLDYMAFAKEVEFSQFGDYDPWQTGKPETTRMEALFEQGEQAFAKTTHPFLKERYAFQLVKLMYYAGGEVDALTRYYDTYLKGHHTIVADWGLLYYANVQPNRVALYCEAWQRSEEKKSYIYNNLSRKDLDTLLLQQPDLTIAWFIRGLKEPGRALPVIQRIHQLAPQYQYLPMLVVREVNKLEDWIMTPEVLGFNSTVKENEYNSKRDWHDATVPSYDYYAKKNLLKDQAYMRTVRSYLESILSKSDSNHLVYALAIAHLYNIDGQYAKAMTYLKDIHPHKNNYYRRQWLTEQVVASMHTANIKSNRVKANFYKQLNELMALGSKVRSNNYFEEDSIDNGFSYLLMMLSQQYEKQQDIVTAGLLFEKANIVVNGFYGAYWGDDTTHISYRKIAYYDQHANPVDIDQLIAFKQATHKTDFEKFITPKVWAPDDFYKDVKLSLLVRQQRYKEALGVAEQMDPYFWRDNYDYNSYLPEKYIGSADFLVPGETLKNKAYPYGDKRGILRDIVALSDSLQRFPGNAGLYYRMGNACYNISFRGRGWMLANYGQFGNTGYYYGIGWDEYGRSALNKAYQPAYYQCDVAMNLYKKALVYGGGQKELCAKVLLMLSVCDKDRTAYLKAREDGDTNYMYWPGEKKYRSHYLDVLKEKYAGTQVYADAVTNCPDVK